MEAPHWLLRETHAPWKHFDVELPEVHVVPSAL
jgi:hypothetical protein